MKLEYKNVLSNIKKEFLDYHGLESLVEDETNNLIYAGSKAVKILQLSIDSGLKVFFSIAEHGILYSLFSAHDKKDF